MGSPAQNNMSWSLCGGPRFAVDPASCFNRCFAEPNHLYHRMILARTTALVLAAYQY